MDKIEQSLPNVETMGESLLSVLQPEDEEIGSIDEILKVACGDSAAEFMESLHELLNTPTRYLLHKMCMTCLHYCRTLSKGNVCHKALGVRLEPMHKPDRFILYSLFETLCRTCFAKLEYTELHDFLLWLLQEESFSRYVYAVLARLTLEKRNFELAYTYAQKSASYDHYLLYISNLYYDIKISAKKAGLDLSIPVVTENLHEYFCGVPFNLFQISHFDFRERKCEIKVCACSKNAIMVTKDGWNSKLHKKVRESIHDGSFRYCHKHSCPTMREGTDPSCVARQRSQYGMLLKKKAINIPKYMDIIKDKCVEVKSFSRVSLGYDRTCNLRCPSCRSDFFRHTAEDIEILNRFVDDEIVPFLPEIELVTLSACGEALASPHYLYFLKKLSSREYPRLQISLLTNGSWNMREKWEYLGDAVNLIKRVRVSIDGARKETFEKLRYPAKWDGLVGTMEYLSELRAKRKLKELLVNFVVQKDNYDQLAEMVYLCNKWNVLSLSFSRLQERGSSHAFENGIHIGSPFYDDYLREVNRAKAVAMQAPKGCKVVFH